MMNKYTTPSIGTNFRYTIEKCFNYAKYTILKEKEYPTKDDDLKELRHFIEMFQAEWFTQVSRFVIYLFC